MTSTIDWNGQLEAYHEDGRVVAVSLNIPNEPQPDATGDYTTVPQDGNYPFVWTPDGMPWGPKDDWRRGWRIRNTSQAPTQVPQVTSPILPSTEQLDRFEALLGRLEGILGGIGKGEAE